VVQLWTYCNKRF